MKIEIVTTSAEQPYHARIKGDNGEAIWTTENYASKYEATHAVTLMATAFGHRASTFQIDPGSPDGNLGIMLYAYDPDTSEPLGIQFEEVDER